MSKWLQRLLGIEHLEGLIMAFKAEFDEKHAALDAKVDAVKAKVDELSAKEGVTEEEKADIFAKLDSTTAKLEEIVNPVPPISVEG